MSGAFQWAPASHPVLAKVFLEEDVERTQTKLHGEALSLAMKS